VSQPSGLVVLRFIIVPFLDRVDDLPQPIADGITNLTLRVMFLMGLLSSRSRMGCFLDPDGHRALAPVLPGIIGDGCPQVEGELGRLHRIDRHADLAIPGILRPLGGENAVDDAVHPLRRCSGWGLTGSISLAQWVIMCPGTGFQSAAFAPRTNADKLTIVISRVFMWSLC
jgi:hypothetical protein